MTVRVLERRSVEGGTDGPAERWRYLAGELTRRVQAVPGDRWDAPRTTGELGGARRRPPTLVEWMSGRFLGTARLPVPEVPSVDVNPAAAWRALDDAVQAAALDDPATAQPPTDSSARRMTLSELVAMTGAFDLLVHGWDLARATGQDESLDPGEVHEFLVGMELWDAALRARGHYGPRVAVPEGASEQDRLLAFTGRRP